MAVQWIGSLSDAELLDYLPQLVQVPGRAVPVLPLTSGAKLPGTLVSVVNKASCLLPSEQALKYECYLDSPLVRFLLKRAISDLRVTHYFFW